MSDEVHSVPEDAAGFLESSRRTFMITLRRDGSPTAHPMASWFGPSLYLNTYAASAKAKNLERDDRICCVVTNPSDAERFEGAVFRGRARLVPQDEVFADEVPPGLAWARNPRSQGSQEKPEPPPENLRKIGDTAGRVQRGLRVIFEISPDEVGMLQNVREE